MIREQGKMIAHLRIPVRERRRRMESEAVMRTSPATAIALTATEKFYKSKGQFFHAILHIEWAHRDFC